MNLNVRIKTRSTANCLRLITNIGRERHHVHLSKTREDQSASDPTNEELDGTTIGDDTEKIGTPDSESPIKIRPFRKTAARNPYYIPEKFNYPTKSRTIAAKLSPKLDHLSEIRDDESSAIRPHQNPEAGVNKIMEDCPDLVSNAHSGDEIPHVSNINSLRPSNPDSLEVNGDNPVEVQNGGKKLSDTTQNTTVGGIDNEKELHSDQQAMINIPQDQMPHIEPASLNRIQLPGSRAALDTSSGNSSKVVAHQSLSRAAQDLDADGDVIMESSLKLGNEGTTSFTNTAKPLDEVHSITASNESESIEGVSSIAIGRGISDSEGQSPGNIIVEKDAEHVNAGVDSLNPNTAIGLRSVPPAAQPSQTLHSLGNETGVEIGDLNAQVPNTFTLNDSEPCPLVTYLSKPIQLLDAAAWNDIPKLLAGLTPEQRCLGVLLVQLPKDAPGQSWQPPPNQSSFQFMLEDVWQPICKKTRTGGLFQIWNEDTDPKVELTLEDLEAEYLDEVPETVLNSLVEKFESRCTKEKRFVTPRYAINVPAHGKVTRQKLHLSPVSPLHSLCGNGLMKTKKQFPGIHLPMLYLGLPGFGSPFGAHVEDFWLIAINYVIKGDAKIWIIINPDDNDKFEALWGEGNRACSQFVRHRYCWVPRRVLERNHIRYTVAYQQQGHAVITLEKVYHFGFNKGANIAEAVNWIHDTFIPDNAYIACSKKCSKKAHDFIDRDGMSCRPGLENHDLHSPDVPSSLTKPSMIGDASDSAQSLVVLQAIEELKSHPRFYKMAHNEVKKIAVLVDATGSNAALVLLGEAFKVWTSGISLQALSHHAVRPSIKSQWEAMMKLESSSGWVTFLYRHHIVGLVKCAKASITGSDHEASTWSHEVKTRRGSGNPQRLAVGALINAVFLDLDPTAAGIDPQNRSKSSETLYRRVTKEVRLGNRYSTLVESYGPGILGLIPVSAPLCFEFDITDPL